MTKYGKTKKLMKETGISKKEAQDFLRRAGWNYEDAKVLWAVSKLPEINFEKILDDIAEACRKLTEKLPEIIHELTANVAPIIQKITEAAAAGIDEDEIRARLGIQSDEGEKIKNIKFVANEEDAKKYPVLSEEEATRINNGLKGIYREIQKGGGQE